MALFELYFSDLTPEAQSNILECAGLKDETEANWDCFPITTIEFEDEDDEVE